MAKQKVHPLVVLLGFLALALDLAKAREHQQTCRKCLGRDYVDIALDVAHLITGE